MLDPQSKHLMKSKIFLRIVIMLALYFGLQYFGGDIGRKIMYPIRILVTFLHELGHAVGALITGGWVERIQINPNGSGFTSTAGGSRSVILMGGYLGSALFGNILFFIGARSKFLVKPMLLLLALSMTVTALYWYNSLFTTGVLILFVLAILFFTFKTDFGNEILMFFGLASILFIIQDFNVGPTSDLEKYAEIMVVFPPAVWMYIWLGVAIVLFGFNLKMLFSSIRDSEDTT